VEVLQRLRAALAELQHEVGPNRRRATRKPKARSRADVS